MSTEHPRVILAIGFALVLFGAAAPFLMVVDVLPTSFALCFLSYGASVAGIMLALIKSALKAEAKPA